MMDTQLNRKQLEVSEIRAALNATDGQAYWRSLDELAQTPEFTEWVGREFPEQAAELKDPVSRRNFLKLMGASLAFGGLTGCTIQPAELIVPQVRAPEEMVPGKPQFYATAVPLGGIASGILVESHMGRPTKIEGNPQHPASLGSTHPITQAAILDLYDPDRAQTVKNAGQISTWGLFLQGLEVALGSQRVQKGAGLRLLTGTITSPTLGHQIADLRSQFPLAKWHQYEPVNRDHVRAGAELAFGEPVNIRYDLSKADVILSLDADFAFHEPGNVRYARDFASRRRVRDGQQTMNRLYMAETTPTATGSLADHRLALTSAQIETLSRDIALRLGGQIRTVGTSTPLPEKAITWLEPLIRDLDRNRGKSLVVAGDEQAPAVHALVHAINQALGNIGQTVHYTKPLEIEPVDQLNSLRELVADIHAGQVELLVIVGGNPVFDAPADLDFGTALQQIGLRVHLSPYADETSYLCHWHIPESHFLETWGDARAYDGTATIIQPLIEPLYRTKSAHELLAVMTGQTGKPIYDIIREYWQQNAQAADFESFWRHALHDGLIPETDFPTQTVSLRNPLVLPPGQTVDQDDDLELVFRPDPLIWDGRFANNGWLQELPKPITKLTWDNAALLSPATAERLGLANEQIAELRLGGKTLRAPVWIVPGQADGAVTLHLGYGRKRVGRVGDKTGVDAYSLRTSTALWSAPGLQLVRTFDRHPLACTQDHYSMEGRALVRQATLDEYTRHPDFAHQQGHDPPADLTLYDRHEYEGYAWGMVIDLNTCLGCNACSVACQAENNIPVVGKEQVLNGREMAWIRVDRYYKGELDAPEIVHQPVPCMHCENAPCEVVCPVAATSHSKEGLNDMVYNRCVGTRYCANNCPYKVRRFNFLQYTDRDSESLKMQRNPDVTVRSRGVMEKCTYCVQRINAARIEAKKDDRPIRDGEVITACQQACPTEAIVFGDLNDPQSQIARLKASPLNYGILTELNTRPRTTYLAGLKNPNPEMGQS